MTTPALSPRPSAAVRGTGPAQHGPSLRRVVAAEWSKLTSLRSPLVLAVVTVAVSGVLTFLAADASSTDPGFDPLDSLTAGLPLAVLGTLVLGILVGTGEFSTGAYRSTFVAVPRRLPVLAAQVVVTTASALVVAVLAVGAAVIGLLPAAGSRGISVDLSADQTPQVLLGMVAYLVGMALVGLALGALLRRPVAAVTVAVVLVLLLPVALLLASELVADPTAPSAGADEPPLAAAVSSAVAFLPGGAGSLLTMPSGGGGDGGPELGQGGAGLVVAAWVAVPLAVAAYRLRRRDLV